MAASTTIPTANARWYTEATAAQTDVRANAGKIDAPILLLYGGEDKVADADVTEAWAPSLKNADSERLAGFYHELINEPPEDRQRVMSRIITWIQQRVA